MKSLAIAMILMTLAGAAWAQPEVDGRSNGQLLRKSYDSTVTNQDREYFLYLPKGYETEEGRLWPVLVFLHGDGERGDGHAELEKLLVNGPLMEAWTKGRDLPFIMISPQMPMREQTQPPPSGRAPRRAMPDRPPGPPPMARTTTGEPARWGDEGPPQGWWLHDKDVMEMVDSTLRDYRGDPARVYISGLSYGGFGTWHFAAAHPERWAAAAPICGAANPKTVARIAEAKLPIWIFHGGRDPVVPVESGLQSAVALEAAGHPDVRFTVHEDRTHDVWTRVYEGWDVYNWLLSHRRE